VVVVLEVVVVDTSEEQVAQLPDVTVLEEPVVGVELT
jgi:hypothetical protein